MESNMTTEYESVDKIYRRSMPNPRIESVIKPNTQRVFYINKSPYKRGKIYQI